MITKKDIIQQQVYLFTHIGRFDTREKEPSLLCTVKCCGPQLGYVSPYNLVVVDVAVVVVVVDDEE